MLSICQKLEQKIILRFKTSNFPFYKYDISDGRHSIAPCESDVAAPGPGPGAGEHKPRVNDLPVTLNVVRGDTRNLLVVEVVVDVETENCYIYFVENDTGTGLSHLVLSSTPAPLAAQVTRMSPLVKPLSGE